MPRAARYRTQWMWGGIWGLLCVLATAGLASAAQVTAISQADPSMYPDTAWGIPSSISADGRYVVFESGAGNLVANQVEARETGDIFLHDRVTGTTVLVSRAAGTASTAANGTYYSSYLSRISADGGFVVYVSTATNLVPGQSDSPGTEDVFLYDRVSGTTTLVSHSAGSATASGNGSSTGPQISADGAYVVFQSKSTGLTALQSDANGTHDVFLYERATGTISLLSRVAGSASSTGNGESGLATLSADGAYIAFESTATNLVAGLTDTNQDGDVFLFDRIAGTVSLVSRSAPGVAGNALSARPQISADGSRVVFASHATNLVAGQIDFAGTADVFLYSRLTGDMALVSHAPGSTTTTGSQSALSLPFTPPALSADGRYVAFESFANDLIAGQTDFNNSGDVFLYDGATGAVVLVSRFQDLFTPEPLPGGGQFPQLSADGRFVVFISKSGRGGNGQFDGNGQPEDVYLYDRDTGTLRYASLRNGSFVSGNDWSRYPVLSGDGRYVAFGSMASDLVPEVRDLNGYPDVFLFDRVAGTNTVVSLRDPAAPSLTAGAIHPHLINPPAMAISPDGRYTAFTSKARTIVAGQEDRNSTEDVFLYDRVLGTRSLVSRSAGSATRAGIGSSTTPAISADGRWIAFLSNALDLVPGQTGPSGRAVFLYDRDTGALSIVSRSPTAPTSAVGSSYQTFSLPPNQVAISADGRWIVFPSTGHLVEDVDDVNGTFDVFLFDRDSGDMTLVSHSAGSTTTGDSYSGDSVMSADGRWIAFCSRSTDLVAGQDDYPGSPDLFLFDRDSGAITLVSQTAGSTATASGGVRCQETVISADGRFVAFASTAGNLVAGQTDMNGYEDVFVYDRETGTTALVSRTAGNPIQTGSSYSQAPSVSADGRFIAFLSRADNLMAGQQPSPLQYFHLPHAFLYDRVADTTVLVSRMHGSPTMPRSSESARISADGRWVAFTSFGTDLLPGQQDTNGASDLFAYDRISGAVTLVSRAMSSPFQAGNGGGDVPVLSSDGRWIAFLSASTDLVPGDHYPAFDAFLFANPHSGSYFTLSPCRLLDTRQPQDGPALASGVPEVLNLHGVCGIPVTARVVSINVTVTQPTGAGHLTLYAGDASLPPTSTINFSAGQTRANNALLALATNGMGTLAIRPAIAGGGAVHVILDVVGYFE